MKKIIFIITILMSLLSAYPCFGSDKKKYRALSLNFGKSHLPSFLYYNLVNGMLGNRYGGNFTLGLTDNLLIQAESSYSVAKGSFYNYINGEEDLNQKIIYKQISFFEPAVLINSFKTKKFIFYSGIGFGYHKYEMNSEINDIGRSSFDKDKTKFTAFTLNFILGIDFIPITSNLWLNSQLKYRLGSSQYHYRIISDNDVNVDLDLYNDITLKSKEITIGLKYIF